MGKKILIYLIIFLVLAGAFSLYRTLRYRQNLRQARQSAKAPNSSVTFLEGWSLQDMADYIEKSGITKSADFLEGVKKFDVSNYSLLLSKPKSADLQGFLFPDTYFIPKTPPANKSITEIIIKKALDNFSQKFTPQMEAQAKTDEMSVYQIITLASIIEKETGRATATAGQKQALDEERKTIAGIFYNRLQAGVPLQSDATVNFVTKKNLPSVDEQDTRIDSPYNTYKYKGLPPGPICNPSLSSILAAVYPEKTNFMYFLHDQATGKAIYATTYEEHLKNKQKYLK